jgi:WD40 repeat protein
VRFLKLLLFIILIFSFTAEAQLYYFGRNKVQYQSFEWKVLRTNHFNIYYYGEFEEIAEIGASYAEEAYDELKVEFNNLITHPIPLIFYNTSLQFQQTNTTPGLIPDAVGGFFEFIKGRVVIPFTGSIHEFKHVIRHELVHVFMTTEVLHILADHREPTDRFPPLWFTEGLAEYLSAGIDAQAEMVMRDAVINNYFVGLDDIYKIYGTFLMYKEGQNFLHFVKDTYGPEKVMLLIDNIWMFNNFNKVLEHTLGKSIEEIDADWLFYLKRKYYPLLSDKAPLQHAAEKLTHFGFNFSPVAYKINGDTYLYFPANRDGYSSLYRMKINVEKKSDLEPELVIRGEKTSEFETFHLFQTSIDISKDGLVAFVTKSGATDVIHFYSIPEEEVIKDYRNENLINITSPKFSEDGKRVVFQAIDQKGFSDLYILDLNTDKLIRLTNDYYDERDPAFGLSDNQVIFTSDRTAGENARYYNLFSYDLNTHRIKYITNLPANVSSPVLSPDKKTLLFTSDLDKVQNIWRLKYKTNAFSDSVWKVTHFITSAFYPRYIDSATVAFSGFENFAFNLYKDNINSVPPDSSFRLVMNFDSIGGKWEEEQLKVYAEKEKYKYKKEYTLDYATSEVTTDPIYGTRGGAILSLSDLFGDDNYLFLIYNTATVQSEFLKSFNILMERINLSERTNYGYGVFHFSGRRYDIRESDEYFFERSFGGFFVLNFPLSKFRRIEADVSIANSDKEVIPGIVERKALLVSNRISYVADNSLWGPTGPLDGYRARFLLGYTSDVKYSNVNFFTVIADYRHYFRIGYTTALAFRGALFYNQGKEARRYFMGGSWDLRGWPRWSIRGEKLWISSLEFRFPLINQINIKFPFVNLGFYGIRGAVYSDFGGAWDEIYKQTLGSVGFGFRMNLLGVIVLRYDMGKKIENNLKSFQHGLFYQFFFGWDF